MTQSEQTVEEHFISRQNFSNKVEALVFASKGQISFIDAVVSIAEWYHLDIQDTPKYLTKRVKTKIESEAIADNLLVSSNCTKENLNQFFG